ncbi:MAG: hypothetical protein ACLRNQ_14995 [Flavonifractor plautii]
MSAVTLLCADRPLPLYDSGIRRVETSSHGGYTVRIEASGFSVGEHTYYREAVEDLYLTMKPCRYELDLRATQEDAAELRAYLAKHLRPGETVELWNLWVGDGPARPRRFSGTLGDVELDTLKRAGGELPDLPDHSYLTGGADPLERSILCRAIASDASTRRSSGSWPPSSAP